MPASWKKAADGNWYVLAIGCKPGDVVHVVSKSTGKVKAVQLGQPLSTVKGLTGPLAGHVFTYAMLSGPASQYPDKSAGKTPPAAVAATTTFKGPKSPKPATKGSGVYAPRTQKAKGVGVLAKHGWPVPAHAIHDGRIPFVAMPSSVQLPAFCRPCPIQPRHGFVDSRVVHSIAEIEDVRTQAVAADDSGQPEIMLMPPLDGKWSAILTPTALSIGPGHDAATAGHGAVSFPLTDAKFAPDLIAAAGIVEAPYLEIVEHAGDAMAVQLRSGPATPRTVNYIPKQVAVVTVVDARPITDLLEWEAVAKGLDPATTVVIAENLVCHQAAHCTLRGIAVVTDGRPLAPGMILKPEGEQLKVEVEAFRAGLQLAMPKPDTDALRIGLLALHQAPYLLASETGARLVGLAARTVLGLSAVACHGEARHKIEKGLTRDYIFTSRYADAETDVHFLLDVFNAPGWSSAYGGPKWAKCTAETIVLRDAIRACWQQPSADAVTAVIDGLNRVVNSSHNTGAFLNKFGSGSNFDAAAKADAKWIGMSAAKAVWVALSDAIMLPPAAPLRKKFRVDTPKQPKPGRTYAARARLVSGSLRVQVIPAGMTSHVEKDFPTTPTIEAAWAAVADNCILPSLAGTGAMYAPGFVRGNTLYLRRKAGWYVTTGLQLPAGMIPATKKQKAAAKSAAS